MLLQNFFLHTSLIRVEWRRCTNSFDTPLSSDTTRSISAPSDVAFPVAQKTRDIARGYRSRFQSDFTSTLEDGVPSASRALLQEHRPSRQPSLCDRLAHLHAQSSFPKPVSWQADLIHEGTASRNVLPLPLSLIPLSLTFSSPRRFHITASLCTTTLLSNTIPRATHHIRLFLSAATSHRRSLARTLSATPHTTIASISTPIMQMKSPLPPPNITSSTPDQSKNTER